MISQLVAAPLAPQLLPRLRSLVLLHQGVGSPIQFLELFNFVGHLLLSTRTLETFQMAADDMRMAYGPTQVKYLATIVMRHRDLRVLDIRGLVMPSSKLLFEISNACPQLQQFGFAVAKWDNVVGFYRSMG